MATLAERLVQLKKEKGIKQKAIAEKAGLSLRGYQRYEKGEREPNASTLMRLADIFGVSIDYLVGRTENREINQ